MLATMSDAHREWHLNSGVPMGTPGCPQDACHPVDEYEGDPPTVRCGNRAVHGDQPGYHYTAAGVRECYASTGRFSGRPQQAPAPQVQPMPSRGAWHSTGPKAEQGHYESQCPGSGQCPVMDMESLSVNTRMVQMRQASEAAEAERKEAARQRYASWRSIPVFGQHNRGYYAVSRHGSLEFFRVERPTEGKWAGKTFVKRQSSDSFDRMEWGETGEVLDAIAADPETAGRVYGQEIGRCYRCHRTLTDKESRSRGLGPDCAEKMGL